MKKCITLLFCLFFASLSWGQFQINFQTGGTDDTANLGTVNHWKALPQGGSCTADTLRIGGDGYTLCLGGNGYPYYTTPRATSWQPISAMGNGMANLAPVNAENIYALWKDGGVRHWDGSSAWTIPNSSAWLQKLNAAHDGTLVGIANTTTYESTDNGSSWFPIAGGGLGAPYLTDVAAADSGHICGTDGSKVYLDTNTGGFLALPAQPASSGIAGCVITAEKDSIYAWGSFGVKRYDLMAGTWNVVTGLSAAGGMTTGYMPLTLALDSNGTPHHLNRFPGWIAATLTGQQGCPVGFTCVSTTYHHGYIQVYLPHGSAGQQADQRVLYNANMNVTSHDFAPACDPIFGATQTPDPECQAALLSSVICEVSGENLTAGQNGQPPAIGSQWSEWVGSYGGSYVIESQGHIMPDIYVARIGCAAIGTCRPPTTARCAPPLIEGVVVEGGACAGSGCTPSLAVKKAEAGCKEHSVTGGPPGAWGFFSNYTVVNGTTTCRAIYGYDQRPYIDPCY